MFENISDFVVVGDIQLVLANVLQHLVLFLSEVSSEVGLCLTWFNKFLTQLAQVRSSRWLYRMMFILFH